MQAHPPACRRPAGSGLLRALAVLLACCGIAGVTLAAASGAPKDPAAAVVAAALAHRGDAYVWGGDGPTTWDCSGLTSTLWREVGGATGIPRTSRQQHAWAVPLPVEQLLPGDLAFFGDPVTHVGLVERKTTTRGVTTVMMIDAASSRGGVVERAVWTSGVVRYGRVKRAGMVPVAPWTPKPTVTPTPRPATTAQATTSPRQASTAPDPRAVVPLAAGKKPLAGLSTAVQGPSSAVAARAAVLARAALGNTRLTDVGLVRNVWQRAGGVALPDDRDRITAATRRVSLSDARVGDLVVYAAPYDHVGIYVGDGLMVDGSRALGRVVLRRVWAGQGVTLRRLSR